MLDREISPVDAQAEHPCLGADFDIVDAEIFEKEAVDFTWVMPIEGLDLLPKFGCRLLRFDSLDFVGFFHG